MRPSLLALSLLALPTLTAACNDTQAATRQRIVVTGSSTLAPLVSEIAKRYEAVHPGVRIDVQTGGSSRGIADVHQGLADIGMSSRDLSLDEIANTKVLHMARDGVGFVVHRDNPTRTLTVDELREIYTGRIQNWSELGGQEFAITVISRAEGRSELSIVCAYFGIDSPELHANLIAGETEQAIKLVAQDTHAIVYGSIGTAEFDAQLGTPIRLLPLAGIEASTASVRRGDYPLTRPLLFVTSKDPSPLVADFLAYARSADVHDLVEELSFVPLD